MMNGMAEHAKDTKSGTTELIPFYRFAACALLLSAGPLYAQATKLPAAEEVKALQAKYQSERDEAVKKGIARRFPPALIERADALAQKGEAALTAGRLLQASEALRQARWQLPYQAPGTPAEHVARIIGNPRLRHSQPILAVAFSPDGQRLATGSGDFRAPGVVKIWDLANGHEILTYAGHDCAVHCVAFSLDGQTIASAGSEPVIRLWDPATGKNRITLKAPGDEVKAVAFSRDGKYLFAGVTPKPGGKSAGLLVCFDAKTGDIKRTDDDFRGRVSSVTLTGDGNILAAGVEDGQVRLWQYPAMVENPKLPAYWMKQHETGAVYAVAFSPDGKTLVCSGPDSVKLYNTVLPGAAFQLSNPRLTLPATSFTKTLIFSKDGKNLFTGSQDGLIRYWDPETGQLLGSFKGHGAEVRSLAFNPAGNQLASAGFDFTVRLWDFDIVIQARDIAHHDGPIWSAAFSPDGTRVVTASADRTARVWELAGGKPLLTLTGHNAPVTMALYSPDAKYIASVGSDKMLRLWDPASGAPLRSAEGHTATITSIDVSSDGKRLVTGGADRRIKVWNAETCKEMLSIDDNPSLVAAVALRPDGKQIAVGNVDQTICLYDAASGKLEHRWIAHGIAVNCLAYSPNGQFLASGGNDTFVKVWPLANPGEGPITLSGHTGPVSGVAFRKDSQHVASASADQLVKLWKVEGASGKEVQTFRGHRDWVTSVAFNKEGFYLVSASVDHLVKIWEITSREAPLLAEHTADVRTVAVSPDGKQIASGAADKTIKLWDHATGVELATLHGHIAPVRALAYAPGGKLLISSGDDRTIRLWDTAAPREIPKTGEQELYFKNMISSSFYTHVTPDGKRLLAWFPVRQANLTTIVECFELQTGKRLFNFNETNRKVHSLSFAANGKVAATGAADGSVRLWKLSEDRAEIFPGGDWSFFPGAQAGGVGDIALTADGTTLVVSSGKGEVKIADVAKREVRQTFTAHKGVPIHICLASPDGKRVVTCAADQLVKCWDMETGKELRQWHVGPPEVGGDFIRHVAFTPDSRQLVTANADTTLFVLDLP
jgi:WD40 repeat protein